MTLTIELSQAAERRLLDRAVAEGGEAEAIAASVLTRALELDAIDAADAAEGVRRGLAEFESGRFRSFRDFSDEQHRKHSLGSE